MEIVSLILEQISKNSRDGEKKTICWNMEDRLGHDRRYATYPKKMVQELGWFPETSFETGMQNHTVLYRKKKSTAKK